MTSRRQREIMREIVEDREYKAIAQRLGLSPRTVAAEIPALKELFGWCRQTWLRTG
ncbi:LuxR C-terminal-related transcriptional regulator [Streptomyces sp. NPDC056086]|uniref:LuxR C-terminal-related transcriptional regulator n=1 Tax=Streptomyces sp. NPDC056086 TaxID=3345709 RepID=UPI0035DB32F8